MELQVTVAGALETTVGAVMAALPLGIFSRSDVGGTAALQPSRHVFDDHVHRTRGPAAIADDDDRFHRVGVLEGNCVDLRSRRHRGPKTGLIGVALVDPILARGLPTRS